ncbi:MAG: Sir2 family NAD-dependent protein deacetylase [Halovenus sp.]
MDDRIERLATELRSAAWSVAFTGAGVSTASGIPDFRSEDGIWADHDPQQFHIRAFERDPGAFWERMLAVHEDAFGGDPEPNPAHRALATLERLGYLDAVVTQNADRLHQSAGSDEVIELHGTLKQAVCRSCTSREPFDAARSRAEAGELPPTCTDCGSPLKPDGVLFGEQLPEYPLYRASALSEKCDVFLAAGSSLTVEPAASLPETAVDHGATLAIVNLDPTPLDDVADVRFRSDVTTVLPRIAEAVR